MRSPHGARPRARSAFAAAFLSLLFPGLGHAYAGAWHRALAFAAAPILLLSLVAGIVVRMDRAELLGFLFVPWVLPSIFVLNLVALAYRLVAIVDAYRVTHYLNTLELSGDGRTGRARVPLHPLSVAGLLAVVLVMSGAHVAVARYDLILSQTADCIFDPNRDCADGTPRPTGSGPIDSADPGEPSLDPSPVGTDLPDVTAPPWDGTERLNILLIGADEQGGAHNTDTLIVVSVDPVTKQVAMFSLPRDTVDVPIPAGPARSVFGRVYQSRINSLYARVRNRPDLFPGTDRTRGYNALKAVLGELYGLDIKYFVEVNFDGFRRVVDAVGGVTINVQIPVVDDRFPAGGGALRRLFIPAGVQHMDGEQALAYARSRNTSNDYDRGQRQQRVLLSLRQSADIPTILPRIDALAAAVGTAIRTDIPRSLVPRLLGLADDVDTRQLRSYVFAPPRYGTEGTRGGFVIFPDVQRIRSSVRAAFELDPEFEARRERLAEEGATVWVLNGSGRSGQASQIAGYLDYQGIAASAPNQRPDRNPPTTIVRVYNGAEARIPETIELLESVFEVTAELVEDPAVRVDVIVITSRTTPELAAPVGP